MVLKTISGVFHTYFSLTETHCYGSTTTYMINNPKDYYFEAFIRMIEAGCSIAGISLRDLTKTARCQIRSREIYQTITQLFQEQSLLYGAGYL